MNKSLIVLVFFLIMGTVFVSGCTSMGEENSGDSGSGDDSGDSNEESGSGDDNSGDSNEDSDSKGYNSGITNFKS
ncbi:MAG: hypothetical protein Q8M06_09095 [Methanobacteriaceae archaeon]|nr:hypothetical protein [Methanobacteriaceae archaeon]